MDTRVSGTTKLMAVIGSPIRHTGSPLMYNYCFDHYGIDCVYMAFESDASQVKETIEAMKRLNFHGGNVTMPCKQAVAKEMDWLSLTAKITGAVNTIVNDHGVLKGYMTDGLGVVWDLKDRGKTVENKRIVLLGVGGAAMAVMVQCALEGAKSISVFNRGEEGLKKAQQIGEKMKEEGVDCLVEFHLLSEKETLYEKIKKADILINATSVGMRPSQEGISLVKDMSVFHEDLIVYDAVYNPPKTKLMEDAINHGCKVENVINGEGMLLWQGAAAFEHFTGLKMPTEELKDFLQKQKQAEKKTLQDITTLQNS